MVSRNAIALLLGVTCPLWAAAQAAPPTEAPAQASPPPHSETTDDYNQRLGQIKQGLAGPVKNSSAEDYRIGPQDLLEISIFEAPELNRTVRVTASGEISLPLLGTVQTADLTPKVLEVVLQELLRHSYMKDPHVGVFVREMQSHPVSVFGAVKKPGVFQIGGAKTLVEVLSMAEGLAEDAGDTVIVMRGADLPSAGESALTKEAMPEPKVKSDGDIPNAASRASGERTGGNTVEINLKDLLESGNARDNVAVYPGDVVKVTRAGVVYVEGEVKKPGGFMLKTNENISVLQAVAMAEGLTHTAARGRTRIIRTDATTGARIEVPINLDKILAGTVPDPLLHPKDIIYVPNSAGKSALYGSTSIVSMAGTAAIYRW